MKADKKTLTVEEALERLRAVGMPITREILKQGIRQGAFDFGTVIDTSPLQKNARNKQSVSWIYPKLLDQWIAARFYGGKESGE